MTTLTINDDLLSQALELGNFTNPKEAVHTALKEFIIKHQTKELIKLFGTVEYDTTYDYKAERLRHHQDILS